MGKPYADELEALTRTYGWAQAADVGAMAATMHACADSPLISVGNTVRPEFCYSEFVIAIIEHVCCRHGQQMGALRGRPIG